MLSLDENELWRIYGRAPSSELRGSYELVISIAGRGDIVLSNSDKYKKLYPNLPGFVVGELYSELIEMIIEYLRHNPNADALPIEELEYELFHREYKPIWDKKFTPEEVMA